MPLPSFIVARDVRYHMSHTLSPEEFFLEHAESHRATRHQLHQNPEMAFKENCTSDFIAAQLETFGLPVHRGLAGTGVIGVLKCGTSDYAIGLRADMDALPIQEANTFAHKSYINGCMHACGHDGHSAMLLAAAEYLASHGGFDGTVYFIFQPAEEDGGGGRVMVEEGLFDRFPMSSVFGMHNMPGIPLGRFALKPGVMMAGYDRFEVTVKGAGGHAATPHKTIDPIPVAATIILALQSIVSRNMDPAHSAVISVTQLNAGDTHNVIPETATLGATVRYLNQADRSAIETKVRDICTHIASAYGAEAEINYTRGYPPTINTNKETELCAGVLQEIFGRTNVDLAPEPMMGSEDFAYMLQEKPGCYIWAGNGTEGQHSRSLHNPNYDFNDALIPLGAQYWVRLAQRALALIQID